jgi:hypothetical protein
VEAQPLSDSSQLPVSGSSELTLAAIGAYIRESRELRLLDAKIATTFRHVVLPEGSNARQFNAYLLDICIKAGWNSIEDVGKAVNEILQTFDGDTVKAVLTSQLTSALGVEEVGLRPGFSLIAVWKLTERETDGRDDRLR